jgi:hypothetical protein
MSENRTTAHGSGSEDLPATPRNERRRARRQPVMWGARCKECSSDRDLALGCKECSSDEQGAWHGPTAWHSAAMIYAVWYITASTCDDL